MTTPPLRRLVLDRGWTLRADPDGPTPMPPEAQARTGRSIPATVPGAVHADLAAAGLIPDPNVDAQEAACAWVSHTDWVYERALHRTVVGAAERVDLVFDGLDTVARIELDGAPAGDTRNMHRRYRFDITDLIGGGDPGGRTTLAVRLTSAYTEADTVRARLGPRPNSYPEPFNLVRKMACSFGWDWGPNLAGAGIWRPVRIETWNGARIAEIRPLTDLVDGDGHLHLLLDVERAASARAVTLVVEIRLAGALVSTEHLAPGSDRLDTRLVIEDVAPWHPVGYGAPALHALDVRLLTQDGALLDGARRRIGFRSIDLDRTPDATGAPFAVRINGRRVLVKGVNWIPTDVLPGRAAGERDEPLLRDAVDAGCNLVRVWGGGVYESDEFYALCDELGLLVWQDFAFACAAYPEEEPLRSEILAEARDNVARLSGHPSLVIYCGNNENLWLRGAEGWQTQPGGHETWGERYYLHDLPAILAEVDPSRPYTPGSPWSGGWDHDPNDPAYETFHSWDVWNRKDYAHYRDDAPRFVSEFGWQAPPAWRTIRDAVTDIPLTPDSPGLIAHQKAADGMAKLRRGLAAHVPIPTDFDAWHYLTQWNQVKSIDTAIRYFRSRWPSTSGMIVWQLADLWPVISWSAIDGAGRHKPLYHALRESYAERAITIEPTAAGMAASVLNDADSAWRGELVLRRVADSGVDLARRRVRVDAAPRSVAHVPVPDEVARFDDRRSELVVAELDGRRALAYGCEPLDSAFVGAPPTVSARRRESGLAVTVTASTLLRDFLLQPDRLHPQATCDHGFVTLLPGETVDIGVTCPPSVTPDDVASPWVTASLDDVIAARL